MKAANIKKKILGTAYLEFVCPYCEFGVYISTADLILTPDNLSIYCVCPECREKVYIFNINPNLTVWWLG